MKILVCGSLNWSDVAAIRDRIDHFAPERPEIIHGAARGADSIAGRIAEELGLTVTPMPADWDTYGKRAGFIRNSAMLDLEPDLVLAFQRARSKGTQHTVDEARRRGIPVELRRDRPYCELWTDGSGTSSGPCGWAYVLRWIPTRGEVVEREGCGQLLEGTNNRAEMTAVLEGLRRLERRASVVIHTDSEYVMKAFTNGWIASWRSRDWRHERKRNGSKDVPNRDLWELLEAEVAKHQVEWVHVRGHTGIELNERCDKLAGEQRRLAIAAVQLFDAEPVAA